ncbi:MAG: glycosyltransferase family 9 protein [Candidatus Gastranaerophilales bacterium]|nr:glycosyltransferase family 9 protein [Candidatus Gastranaerophilales bacterium]
MENYKNILLINFGGIGDEILFMPVIQSLKRSFSDSKITLCLEGRSSSFIGLTSLIDNHFCVDIKTKNKYIEMLKLYYKALTGRYDLVISSGANPLIAVLLFFTGIKTRVGYKSSKLSEKLLTYPVVLNKNQYASKMYFDLVKPITGAEFEYPCIDIKDSDKIPDSVLIHPGVSLISISKNIIKTISAEKWALLIKKLLEKGKKVYLAGGPDDNKCITQIRENLKDCDLTNFTDMFGKTKNIIELAQLIKKCEVLVCSDSAPMHIGVATQTRTIAIFGPTDEKKLLPESEKYTAIKNESNCRPCLWEKRLTTCNDLSCLDIDITKIIELI